MLFDVKTARQVAKFLLEKKAVILRPDEPFTWASGWRSPIYCDNRILLSFPEVRTYLKNHLAEIIKVNYSGTEALVGVATAGISHAALIADVLDLPMAYCRTSAKDHGRQNLLEGKIEKGKKVVVIEDLISTGKSSLQVIRYLLEEGINVIGLTAIFSYDFDVSERDMKEVGLGYFTLSDYNILVEEALAMDYIKEKDIELLKEWRKNPSEWRQQD
jgi:orotate phosphoribosyltransferase